MKFKKACSWSVELLTDPYYNKFAAEASGEIGCAEPEAEENRIREKILGIRAKVK
jgi:hypothetical protein